MSHLKEKKIAATTCRYIIIQADFKKGEHQLQKPGLITFSMAVTNMARMCGGGQWIEA